MVVKGNITPSAATIAGVILAGGQSRRMFQASGTAGDKGLLDIAGQPMLGHVIGVLGPQVGALVINANGDPARFDAFKLPVAPDTITGHVGPLAGVLAGMRWAAVGGFTHVATVSSDAPFLPSDLVVRLAGTLETTPIALAASANGVHPVIGLWPVALADDLEAALHTGVRKVLQWTDRHGATTVMFDDVQAGDATIDPFFNANTPAEMEEARVLIATLARHRESSKS